MNENVVEKRLIKEVEKVGGKAWKLVCPGISGVPDRIVLLPLGRIIFVELKAPGKKRRKRQEYVGRILEDLGFRVEVIDSIDGVLKFTGEVVL